MAEIEYFYSAHSSYAYLGSARFMSIARGAGRSVRHRPVDLDQVLAGCGSSGFRERTLAFRNYFFNRELERWAEFRNVPTLGRRPTNHHHSPDLANCVIIAAQNDHQDESPVVDELAHRLLSAHWAEEADLADSNTLGTLCADVGLNGAELLEAAATQAVRDRYQAFTAEAIQRSVFGSPTYVVDGDVFYGQDRLEMLERALSKPFARNWPAITA